MKHEYQYCPMCGKSLRLALIEGKERKFCPSCGFIDYKNPLPVAMAIATRGKRFLLIKRGLPPRKGSWGPPSGFIEAGETSEEACLRELKEETGLSGRVVKLLAVARLEDNEVYGDMLIVRYLVEVGDGEPTPGHEVEDVRFFDTEELPDYYARLVRGVI